MGKIIFINKNKVRDFIWMMFSNVHVEATESKQHPPVSHNLDPIPMRLYTEEDEAEWSPHTRAKGQHPPRKLHCVHFGCSSSWNSY